MMDEKYQNPTLDEPWTGWGDKSGVYDANDTKATKIGPGQSPPVDYRSLVFREIRPMRGCRSWRR